eukprot:6469401-Amphidinium_carterae.1
MSKRPPWHRLNSKSNRRIRKVDKQHFSGKCKRWNRSTLESPPSPQKFPKTISNEGKRINKEN